MVLIISIFLLNAVSALPPPSNDNSFQLESTSSNNHNDDLGNFAVTVTIEVGTETAYSSSTCGATVYLQDANNGRQEIQFDYQMNAGDSYSETVYLTYAVNPSNMDVFISAGGCMDSLNIGKIYVAGYQYYLADTYYGSLTHFWTDGDNNPDALNYYCINGVVCKLCYDCNAYNNVAGIPNVDSEMVNSGNNNSLKNIGEKGSFELTVTIEVGTDADSETSCGLVVYVDNVENGLVELQFPAMASGGLYYSSQTVSYAFNPSNSNVMISSGNCNDATEIGQINVAGYQYFLADATYGKLSKFYVDGDSDTSAVDGDPNYYCVSGIVCELCWNC